MRGHMLVSRGRWIVLDEMERRKRPCPMEPEYREAAERHFQSAKYSQGQ
jgi:hypothetical protein